MQIYSSNGTGYDSVIEPSYMTQFQNQASEKQSTLIEKNITENGEYPASDDNADGYSKVTVDVSGGAAAGADVIFYDYDGNVVTSYTATEFANLAVMPSNPTHEGLTAQGWNWSLADAKAYVASYGKLNIGQMYITSDGKTRLYITLPEGRTSPILQLYLNDNSELDIDWGDGGAHSTFTSTTADYKSERHEYATAADYTIAVTVVNGGFELKSSSTNGSSILWNANDSSYSPDSAYHNAIKKIEVGNGVTSIDNYAFVYCYSLSLVTIPDSVVSINNSAFSNCSALLSITIPNSVTSIGSNAFSRCRSLSSVIFPASITSIGKGAFQYCSSLSSVTIPNSITSIDGDMDAGAFQYCSSLSSVTIPRSVANIGDYTFTGCSSLSSITIPDSVTSIGAYAFNYCSSLTSITIPDSVASIGSNAFSSCSLLTSVTIPNSVTSIGSHAFYNCTLLSSITIPDSVTSIADSTFYNCYALSSVVIPDGVTSIGKGAFQSCSLLSSVTIPDSVTSIDGDTYEGAFYGCKSLSSITIPDGVISIGEYVFGECYSLSSITIPSSVTSIAEYAFYDCCYMSFIKFESAMPPTVADKNAWDNVSTSTKILVPTGTLETYKTATNYPNPSTYTYEEY